MVKESREKCLELGHKAKAPRKAVKEFCLQCCNGSWNEVDLCCSKSCVLWQHRKGKSVDNCGNALKYNAKLIKEYCLSCAENYAEIVECKCVNCAFWPFRLGQSPWRSRVMSEERKKEAAERLKKYREKRKNV